MRLSITIEKLHSGLRLSTIYKKIPYHKLYIGYNKKEATRLFKIYVEDEESKIFCNQE